MAKSSLRETLTTVTISFAYAFVFRAFVIEAFVIPTGSMAPTLMGQHVRMRSESTGYAWAVGPWTHLDRQNQVPAPIQKNIEVHDPMIGVGVSSAEEKRLSGDRILVLKYLPPLFSPERYDVVVFKSPEAPQTNFIKRLIGLPGEHVALVDGDVFTRVADGVAPDDATWDRSGWSIQRKPERVQRAVWQPMWDSQFAPVTRSDLRTVSPWALSTGWVLNPSEEGRARGSLSFSGSGSSTLEWKSEPWAIYDLYPYNETSEAGLTRGQRQALQQYAYPVSDVRVSMDIEPTNIDSGGWSASLRLFARGHEFLAAVRADGAKAGAIEFSMRAEGATEWASLSTTRVESGLPGDSGVGVARLEFWHADQRLEVWLDGTRVAHADYDWSPRERIEHATGRSMDEITRDGLFDRTDAYRPVRFQVEFDSGPITLHRLAVDRDIHYQACEYSRNGRGSIHSRHDQPCAGTAPRSTVVLDATQYFTCGDNSPASSDARQWDKPDPWVAATIDPTIGVVPRKLLIGKAFFVYFPSMHYEHWFSTDRAGLPDFGRMRWIW